MGDKQWNTGNALNVVILVIVIKSVKNVLMTNVLDVIVKQIVEGINNGRTKEISKRF